MTITAQWQPQLVLPGQAGAAPGPIDLSGMFVMHHAFRRDLVRIEAAVRGTAAQDRAANAALARRWQVFHTMLNQHHASEDAGLWPRLRRRVHPVHLRTMDAMVIEHETLDSLLEQCSAALRRLVVGGSEHDRQTLVARVTSLRVLIDHHLDHEECEALPLVQRYLTRQEWDEIVKRSFHGTLIPGEMRRLVPWALHGLPVEVRERVLDGSPASFRVAWRLTHRWFERSERAVFGSAAAAVPLTYPMAS